MATSPYSRKSDSVICLRNLWGMCYLPNDMNPSQLSHFLLNTRLLSCWHRQLCHRQRLSWDFLPLICNWQQHSLIAPFSRKYVLYNVAEHKVSCSLKQLTIYSFVSFLPQNSWLFYEYLGNKTALCWVALTLTTVLLLSPYARWPILWLFWHLFFTHKLLSTSQGFIGF